MAEKAQAEPTMEEILASIRKIISDEGEGARPAAARPAVKKEEPSVSVNVQDDDDFEDLSLDDVIEQAGGSAEALSQDDTDSLDPVAETSEPESLLNDVDETMFEDLAFEEASEPSEVTETASDDFGDFELDEVNLDDDGPVAAEFESFAGGEEEQSTDEDWDDEWNRDIPATDEVETPEVPVREEASMLRGKTEAPAEPAPAQASASGAGLTDERIAGAAASALGKLMVKQSSDQGNPNTLEGLMMEMLRPMIKEWLDANLPAIVERKVEEEVQRIARMAR